MQMDNSQQSATRETAYTTPRPDVSALVPPGARRILDVGCSNGMLGASLKFECSDRHVIGIEYDVEFATAAGSRLDRVVSADLDQFDWQTMTADGPFDCIIFADILEHLRDPEHHLKACRDLLQTGGCIIVSLPNIRHLSALIAIYFRGSFPKRDRGIFDRTHIRWFTSTDAIAAFASSGYVVDSTSQAMRLGDKGGGFINRTLNRLPASVQSLMPFREFLTYQFCFRILPS